MGFMNIKELVSRVIPDTQHQGSLCPGRISVQGVCVQGLYLGRGGSLSREDLCPGGLFPAGSLSRGGSLSKGSVSRGGLYLGRGGSLSRENLCSEGPLSSGVSVQGTWSLSRGSLSGESLSREDLCPEGPLSSGVSVQGRGSLSTGFLSRGSLSREGGSLSRGGVSVQGQGELCQVDLRMVKCRRVASYWNAFLFKKLVRINEICF